MNTSTNLENLRESLLSLNQQFTNKEIRHAEKLSKNPNYKYKKGTYPIVFSAPHSVYQIREGKIKKSDSATGALAIFLANKLNCGYIVRTYCNNDDPNYDDKNYNSTEIKNAYLKHLIEKIKKDNIKLVIDLHGASNLHEEKVDVIHGNYFTANRETIKLMENCLEKNNIKTLANISDFSGGAVIRQVKLKTNIPSFSLEITASHRKLKQENMPRVEKVISAIGEFILEFKKLNNIK